MKSRIVRLALSLMACVLAWPAASVAQECVARYFSPSDFAQARPSRRPHAEFALLLQRADAGDPVAQRSLAVAYEAGYLVEKCPQQALAWYRKAAGAGESAAQQWLARYEMFERIRRGPECAARGCPFVQAGDGPQLIELYADSGGAFRVPVTIGGTTVVGIVDTGASLVSMSGRQAREMGIQYAHGRRAVMQTANGVKEARVVNLDTVRLGGIVLHDVAASVSEAEFPLLLGMSFLGRVTVTINEGRMTISSPGSRVAASRPSD